MITRVHAVLLASTAGLSAGGCHPLLTASEQHALAVGEAQWARRGFTNYSFEIRSGCFCPPEINDWARVDIVSGHVSRVVLVASGEIITDSRLSYWSSIEHLFADIRSANQAAYLDDVDFVLDPDLGYPISVSFVSSPNVADAGGTKLLRHVQPLP